LTRAGSDTDALGLRGQPAVERITDMLIEAETITRVSGRAELDPERTSAGYLRPRRLHVAAAAIYSLQAQRRMTEILRELSGRECRHRAHRGGSHRPAHRRRAR